MAAILAPLPSLAELRALARMQGVEPPTTTSRRVLGFLASILPTLRALEEQTARDVPPAGITSPPEAT